LLATSQDILDIMLQNEIRVDIEELDHSESLSEQGLDSLDLVTILFSIEEKFHIKIPEEDINEGKLSSMNSIVSYINEQENK
jgi:acyl carrier protein